MSCLLHGVLSSHGAQGSFSSLFGGSLHPRSHGPHRSLAWPFMKQIQAEVALIWAKHVSSNTSSKSWHPGKEPRGKPGRARRCFSVTGILKAPDHGSSLHPVVGSCVIRQPVSTGQGLFPLFRAHTSSVFGLGAYSWEKSLSINLWGG